jgi:dGTP triphosphohydrolase
VKNICEGGGKNMEKNGKICRMKEGCEEDESGTDEKIEQDDLAMKLAIRKIRKQILRELNLNGNLESPIGIAKAYVARFICNAQEQIQGDLGNVQSQVVQPVLSKIVQSVISDNLLQVDKVAGKIVVSALLHEYKEENEEWLKSMVMERVNKLSEEEIAEEDIKEDCETKSAFLEFKRNKRETEPEALIMFR